jgi:hypothetical protein
MYISDWSKSQGPKSNPQLAFLAYRGDPAVFGIPRKQKRIRYPGSDTTVVPFIVPETAYLFDVDLVKAPDDRGELYFGVAAHFIATQTLYDRPQSMLFRIAWKPDIAAFINLISQFDLE